MRKLLKRFIPKNILERLQKYRIAYHFKSYTAYDENIFLKHSNILYQDTQSKHIGKIVLTYHIIEKGLTMPDMRPGFGKERMELLIDECLYYHKNYDKDNTQFLHALSVIAEYKRVHSENKFNLDAELVRKIDRLLEHTNNIPITEQIKTTKDAFFSTQNAPFDKFSESRHSVRHFEGKVESAQINKAVELAQNAPSACNRQPTRIHIIENRELIDKVLEIQKGSRGFGHLADKLLVVTANLSGYQSAEERNCAYVDGGMYAMNLLYALHFNLVASCSLNWCRSPYDDSKMRELVNIPESEIIILLIACGNVPEEFKLANSKRNPYEEIIKVH